MFLLDLLFKSRRQRDYERFLKILEVFVNNPNNWYTTRDICGKTKLRFPPVLFMLIRMESKGWLEGKYKESDQYPQKRYFRITRRGAGRGKKMLSEQIAEDFSLGDLIPV